MEDGDECDGHTAWFDWKVCDSRIITKQDGERASHQGVKQATSRLNKGTQTDLGIATGVFRM